MSKSSKVDYKTIFDRKILSWALYDWANSAFTTTVMAGFFPLFFKTFWSEGTPAAVTTARLGISISVGSLVMAIISPTLGALADLRGSKKLFCGLFMSLGIACTASLAFISKGDWLTAAVAFTVAMMAFNASCVFYDSLLGAVATHSQMDLASTWGFSLGYLGGGILFAMNVFMYLNPRLWGLSGPVEAVQWSFLSVAIWWGLFSIPMFLNVPEPKTIHVKESIFLLTRKSIQRLNHTVRSLISQKNILTFMLAYWLYIDGVYTVMTMAVDFGVSIGLEPKDLIRALLLTQFIGFPCAWAYGHFAPQFGCRRLILLTIVGYSLTVFFASRMTHSWEFYILALAIGMAQGGIQGLSRSLFAKMIPANQSGEYFGLYNLVGKFASIFGPLVVGLTAWITKDSRLSLLGLLVLFVVGGALLWRVEEPHQTREPDHAST
jgi:UMF1 family MFS transporter